MCVCVCIDGEGGRLIPQWLKYLNFGCVTVVGSLPKSSRMVCGFSTERERERERGGTGKPHPVMDVRLFCLMTSGFFTRKEEVGFSLG